MNKRILSCISIFLMIFLLLVTTNTEPLSAQTNNSKSANTSDGMVASKEEVIYAQLDTTGDVKQIYAVNILTITTSGQVQDYGRYSSVKNLSSTENIDLQTDFTSVNAPIGRFYYQGSLISSNLPWNFKISYSLDGNPISSEELAGKSGKLILHLATTKNPEVDTSFYDNYLLQITIKLDTNLCSNISAPAATIANAGANKMITFTVMPSTEGDISVSADVLDFEMEGIDVSAVPFSMNIETPDTKSFTDQLLLLSNAISQLSSGITSVKNGISELSSGTSILKNGSSNFQMGLDKLDDNSSQLITASTRISSALTQVSTRLSDGLGSNDLVELIELPSALTQLATGLDEIANGILELGTSFSASSQALDKAITAIPDIEIDDDALQALMINNPKDVTLNQLIDYYKAARTVKGTYLMVSPAFAAVNTNLPTMSTSITTISESLKQIATGLTSTIEETNIASSLTELSSGIAELSSNYESFHTGLEAYTAGVAQLAAAYGKLDNGISDLATGTVELNAGMETLNNGANELDTQTADIPKQIETTIDNLLSDYDTSDYAPVSFLSSENKNVVAVQFVMKTSTVKKAEILIESEDQIKTENFWTRFKALFTK